MAQSSRFYLICMENFRRIGSKQALIFFFNPQPLFLMTNFTIGSVHHGFILRPKEQVADISSEVCLFEHELLGTPALAIKE